MLDKKVSFELMLDDDFVLSFFESDDMKRFFEEVVMTCNKSLESFMKNEIINNLLDKYFTADEKSEIINNAINDLIHEIKIEIFKITIEMSIKTDKTVKECFRMVMYLYYYEVFNKCLKKLEGQIKNKFMIEILSKKFGSQLITESEYNELVVILNSNN